MIKRIEKIEELNGFKNESLFYIKIFSLAKAYGFKYDFIRFYIQTIEDSVISILCYLDNDLTIDTILYDNEELINFVSLNGFNTILCSDSLTLPFDYNEGYLMKCNKKFDVDCQYFEVNEYPYLLDLFNFVDYEYCNFDSWYVDISHRIRHNCAKAITINDENIIISSGILSSIFEDKAIISSVRTSPEYYNLGYGSKIVSLLCSTVRSTVYLMRENDINYNFYNRLGFENCGKWREYK